MVLLRLHLVEDGDRQAVEFTVGALGHDLVENPSSRIVADPPRQNLAQLLAIFGLRSSEDLGPHYHLQLLFAQTSGSALLGSVFLDAYIPRSQSQCKGAPNDLVANYSQTIETLSQPRRFEWHGNFHRAPLTVVPSGC